MIHVVALLRARAGDLAALRDYEALVLPMIAEYGGRLVSAFRPEADDNVQVPDEVHILQFPSRDELRAYREDSRHADLNLLRTRAGERTLVLVPAEVIDYGKVTSA